MTEKLIRKKTCIEDWPTFSVGDRRLMSRTGKERLSETKIYLDIFCQNAFFANFEKGLRGNKSLKILV